MEETTKQTSISRDENGRIRYYNTKNENGRVGIFLYLCI